MRVWSFHISAYSAPSESQRPPNKNPKTRYEKFSSDLLVRAIQETPKTYSLLLLLWPPPEVERKSMLLKNYELQEQGWYP